MKVIQTLVKRHVKKKTKGYTNSCDSVKRKEMDLLKTHLKRPHGPLAIVAVGGRKDVEDSITVEIVHIDGEPRTVFSGAHITRLHISGRTLVPRHITPVECESLAVKVPRGENLQNANECSNKTGINVQPCMQEKVYIHASTSNKKHDVDSKAAR